MASGDNTDEVNQREVARDTQRTAQTSEINDILGQLYSKQYRQRRYSCISYYSIYIMLLLSTKRRTNSAYLMCLGLKS